MGFREQTFWESPRIGGGMAKNGISRARIWRSNICRRQIDKSVTNSKHLSPFGVDDLAAGHQDSQQNLCSTKKAKSQNQVYEHLQQHFLAECVVYIWKGDVFFSNSDSSILCQCLILWLIGLPALKKSFLLVGNCLFPEFKNIFTVRCQNIFKGRCQKHFWHQHDRFWNCWYVANVQRCDQKLEEAGKVPQPLFHYLCLCHPATLPTPLACTVFYVHDTSGATSPSVFLKRM